MKSNKELTGYPSIDKPWLKYYPKSVHSLKPQECTVYRGILDNNAGHLDDTAILYFGKDISYRVMFDKVDKCAKALKCIGIREGDCVTLCTAGVPEAIYIVLACSKIGAVANFINPLFSTDQMIARINDTGAKWVFILDEMYSYIGKALAQTSISNVVIIPVYNSMPITIKSIAALKGKSSKILKEKVEYKTLSWNDFEDLADSYSENTEIEYKRNRPVIMVYSSGTTGASKGIVLTNDGINATILDSSSEKFPYERGYRFLQMIPVWFSTGIVLSVLTPLCLGITVIPEPIFNTSSFVKDMLKYKPEMTLVATSIWVSALLDKGFQNIDLTNMKYPMTGGEKIIARTEREINSFLQNHGCKSSLLKGYGMCELGGKVSDSIAFRNGEYSGSVGTPMIGVTVSSFDIDTNKELKYNEHGEIRVYSPGCMKEYYKNETATKEFFYTDDNGVTWGRTGDIGYINVDGVIYILGRATDCAILDNGKKVYLFDIEDVILHDEFISGCKVVATKENGHIVLAAHMTLYNELSENDKNKLAYKLYYYCCKKLSIEQVPTKYKFRKSFPVHPNGKRDNSALAADTEGFIIIDSPTEEN